MERDNDEWQTINYVNNIVKQIESYLNTRAHKAITNHDITIEEVALETAKDSKLNKILDFLKSGKTSIPKDSDFDQFRGCFEEISTAENGILYKADKIIIPPSLQHKMIVASHFKSHRGAKACTRMLADSYYFANMSQSVEQEVSSCIPCQVNTNKTRFNPIIPSDLPSRNMETCSIDFSSKTPSGEYLLVILCERSRYPIIKLSAGLTTSHVISILKRVFKEFGTPGHIKSDNGPAFKSKLFAAFARKAGFDHIKISPEWPRANGMCERFMRNINKIIRCSMIENTNWKLNLESLLKHYRATPHTSTGATPNDVMGLKNDNGLPINLKKQKLTSEQLQLNDTKSKLYMKNYANRNLHAKRHSFQVNDKVLFKWRPTNKQMSRMDVDPYMITQVKGTMITAENWKHTVTRNSSCFQHFKGDYKCPTKRKSQVTLYPIQIGKPRSFILAPPTTQTPPVTPALNLVFDLPVQELGIEHLSTESESQNSSTIEASQTNSEEKRKAEPKQTCNLNPRKSINLQSNLNGAYWTSSIDTPSNNGRRKRTTSN